MIDELLLQRMCNQYNIKYQIMETTNIILLDSGLDQWMVKIESHRDRPYCLMHKNKLRQTKKYHTQRYLRTLGQLLDSVASHKRVLINIFGSSPIHKQKNKINKSNKHNYNNKKGITC
jgi:hypothetical protein